MNKTTNFVSEDKRVELQYAVVLTDDYGQIIHLFKNLKQARQYLKAYDRL